jgi:hypothetical protein
VPQKFGYSSVGLGSFLRGSRPLDILSQVPACGDRNGIKAAVLREPSAAVDAKRGQRYQQKKCASHIVLLSSR